MATGTPPLNPRAARPLLRRRRVERYTRPDRRDFSDGSRLIKHLGALKNYINEDFRGGTLGDLAFDILENERVQGTQWARTLKRFLEAPEA